VSNLLILTVVLDVIIVWEEAYVLSLNGAKLGFGYIVNWSTAARLWLGSVHVTVWAEQTQTWCLCCSRCIWRCVHSTLDDMHEHCEQIKTCAWQRAWNMHLAK